MSIDKLVNAVKKKVKTVLTKDDLKIPFFLDSGNYALNYILSGSFFKGWPGGRVVELFGDPSAGKTLLMTHAIRAIQRRGGIAIIDDVEASYDLELAALLGVNPDQVLIVSSKTLEDYVDPATKEKVAGHYSTIRNIVDSVRKEDPTMPILVCLDSLANLTTEHEVTTDLSKPDMSKAKVVKKFMRLMGGYIRESKICYIISNHVISTMSMYGNPNTTPGGKGVKFQASIRLELKQKEKLKDAEKIIGVKTKAHVAKSKISPPFKSCFLEIIFDKGLERETGLFDMLKDEQIITKKNIQTYNVPGYEKAMYRKDIEALIENDSFEFVKNLEKAVNPDVADANVKIGVKMMSLDIKKQTPETNAEVPKTESKPAKDEPEVKDKKD